MNLSQCKIGDRVFVFLNGYWDVSVQKTTSKVSCLILDIHNAKNKTTMTMTTTTSYLLGFDSASSASGIRPNGCSVLSATKYAKQAPYGQWVIDCECEMATSAPAMATKPAKKQEKACPLPGCGAKNYLDGTKKCWRCGHKLPWV